MATTMEVGQGMKSLIEQNKLAEAVDTYYADNITSTEEMGPQQTVTGLDAVKGKMQYFQSAFEIHSIECGDVYPSMDQFILRMTLDATNKHNGERTKMDETALYTVENGKIVHEKFFYDMTK